MAITIDYGNTYVINIPQADLILISGTLYELDTEVFRLALKDIEDSDTGMAFPKTHTRNAPVTVAGTTLAQTLEILPPYSVQFENGSYSVRLAGSNNNIFDVENGILVQNTVQVIAQNSAGLVNVNILIALQQEALFQGSVHLDTINGNPSGTEFPIGTASEPCKTIAQALTIATRIGVRSLFFHGSFTIPSGMTSWTMYGVGAGAEVDVNSQDLSNSLVDGSTVKGTLAALGGPLNLCDCTIHADGLVGYRGIMTRCMFQGDVALVTGHTTIFKCASDVSGVSTPNVNCNSVIVDLSIRDWVGGLEISNYDQVANVGSVDMDSAKLILAPTVSNGSLVVRGVGWLNDSSTGLFTLDRTGLVDAEAMKRDSGILDEIRKLMRNKMVTDPITGLLTIFEEDGVTILFQANLFEDAAGLQTYRGQGAERRERLDLFGQFSPEFSQEFS